MSETDPQTHTQSHTDTHAHTYIHVCVWKSQAFLTCQGKAWAMSSILCALASKTPFPLFQGPCLPPVALRTGGNASMAGLDAKLDHWCLSAPQGLPVKWSSMAGVGHPGIQGRPRTPKVIKKKKTQRSQIMACVGQGERDGWCGRLAQKNWRSLELTQWQRLFAKLSK